MTIRYLVDEYGVTLGISAVIVACLALAIWASVVDSRASFRHCAAPGHVNYVNCYARKGNKWLTLDCFCGAGTQLTTLA